MKPAILFLTALVALGQAPGLNLSGSWEAQAIHSCTAQERCLKVLPSDNKMTLELQVDGSTITGTAVAGNWGAWPGPSDISDGKIEGDRFSFTATGRSPWWSRSAAGVETSGYPIMRMSGRILGDEIRYTFELSNHGPGWASFSTEMRGRRLQGVNQVNQ